MCFSLNYNLNLGWMNVERFRCICGLVFRLQCSPQLTNDPLSWKTESLTNSYPSIPSCFPPLSLWIHWRKYLALNNCFYASGPLSQIPWSHVSSETCCQHLEGHWVTYWWVCPGRQKVSCIRQWLILNQQIKQQRVKIYAHLFRREIWIIKKSHVSWNLISDKVFWHFSINFKIRVVACHTEESRTVCNF